MTSMTTARQDHTATLLPNGNVLVTGGYGATGYLKSVELYDPSTNAWTTMTSMAADRFSHTATLLLDGNVLVTGGYGVGRHLKSVELYDPRTNTWTTKASMAAARQNHTATLLPNGNVLVTGGYGATGYLKSVELYNPSTNTWTTKASMATARYAHTATLLPNGNVLVTGGAGATGLLKSVELYDPSNNTWTTKASMAADRYYHTATLLLDGNVLVTGGYGAGHLKSVELYDPRTNTWTTKASMATARYYHTATLLLDGNVLVTGGYLKSVELYDPSTNTWTTKASMAADRAAHTATLLPNGNVLVTGGWGATYFGSSYLKSVELYGPADTTPPTISASRNPAANVNGWNNSDVTVTATGTDGGSGIAVCTRAVVSTEGAGQSSTVSCTDKAGNTASATVGGINIDKTAPTISGLTTPLPNANGWNNTNVEVTFTCGDALSGVSECTGSTPWQDESTGMASGGIAIDRAGNSAAATVTVRIDKTPPTITVPPDQVVEATGPTGAVVTYSAAMAADNFDVAPAVACVVTSSSPGAAPVGTSGSTFPLGVTTVTCTATDAADNSASASFTVTVRDTTPPVLMLPVGINRDATGPSGASVTFTATATDVVTPSPTVVCTPASGSTFAIGITTVSCTATDSAANTTTGAFTVHVNSASEQAKALADAVDGVGSGTSLSAKVQTLQARIAAGDTTAACNTIKALLNEVSAQTGKKLTLAQAAAITADANRIAAVLGC